MAQPENDSHASVTQDATAELLTPDKVALAERIVNELGGNPEALLARWMSFRIAELLQKAENAPVEADRETAETACADLILRARQARTHWPQGWPPASAHKVLNALIRRSFWDDIALPSDDDEPLSWLGALPSALRSLDNERRLWHLAALSEVDSSDARSWLDQQGAELSPEEHDTLESVINAAEASNSELTSRLYRHKDGRNGISAEADPATRSRALVRELRRSANARLELARRISNVVTNSTNNPSIDDTR